MLFFIVGVSGVKAPAEVGVIRPLRKIPPRKGPIVEDGVWGSRLVGGAEVIYTAQILIQA